MARRRRGLRGASQLRRKLRRLPDEITAETKKEIRDFAEAVRLDAIKLVPKDTGTLARNISKKLARDGLEARVGVLGAKARREAFYAKMVEFGTRPHSTSRGAQLVNVRHRKKARPGAGAGGMHPGVPARPYLFPAFEMNKEYFRNRLRKAIDRALRMASSGINATDADDVGLRID